MFSARALKEIASLLRKNATIIEALSSASSVELYDEGFSMEYPEEYGDVVVLNYYALIGVDGDPGKVIPVPVLVKNLGLSFDAYDLEKFGRWLCQLPIRVAGLNHRTCAIGDHTTTRWVQHQEGCIHRPYPGHDDPEEVSCGCPVRVRCNSCRAEWLEGETPPSTPIQFQDLGSMPIILERLTSLDADSGSAVIVLD